MLRQRNGSGSLSAHVDQSARSARCAICHFLFFFLSGHARSFFFPSPPHILRLLPTAATATSRHAGDGLLWMGQAHWQYSAASVEMGATRGF